MSKTILGISCFYHDSAACILKDGKLIAAAEEERFTRQKHDNSFPVNAIRYCLEESNTPAEELDHVAFYEKPLLKFERILQSCVETYPHSFRFFYNAIPAWINKKLRLKKLLKEKIGYKEDVLFIDHHTSHAASAFFPSPFEEAAILTVDGAGEWKTTALYKGKGNKITPLKEIRFPDSLGLLYSTITAYLGFMVNNDEFKVMGLAAYGGPESYYEEFRKLIDIKKDGSFKLDQKYFSYQGESKMWSRELESLLGPPKEPEEELTQRHMDIAATLQKITEEVMLKTAEHLYEITELPNLCIAGGVGLNCVVNGKLRRKSPFERIWIQPAAGDSGGALGCATYVWSQVLDNSRKYTMDHVFLGPSFSDKEIKSFLEENNIPYEEYSYNKLIEKVAKILSEDKIVSWFQGRMEWGPRALGNRCILANPSNPDMRDIINERVKHRGRFRPFAPSVLEEKADEWFEISYPSPFMIVAFSTKEDKQEVIPSVIHVDGTSRIQTVSKERNKLYYNLIKEFEKKTGVPILLNTSLNDHGEPIVCTPEDAYDCFKRIGTDYLVMGKFLINK